MAIDELMKLENKNSVVAFRDFDGEDTQQWVSKPVVSSHYGLHCVKGSRSGGAEDERVMKTHSSLTRSTDRLWKFWHD